MNEGSLGLSYLLQQAQYVHFFNKWFFSLLRTGMHCAYWAGIVLENSLSILLRIQTCFFYSSSKRHFPVFIWRKRGMSNIHQINPDLVGKGAHYFLYCIKSISLFNCNVSIQFLGHQIVSQSREEVVDISHQLLTVSLIWVYNLPKCLPYGFALGRLKFILAWSLVYYTCIVWGISGTSLQSLVFASKLWM